LPPLKPRHAVRDVGVGTLAMLHCGVGRERRCTRFVGALARSLPFDRSWRNAMRNIKT
jgi:hypothetical protein